MPGVSVFILEPTGPFPIKDESKHSQMSRMLRSSVSDCIFYFVRSCRFLLATELHLVYNPTGCLSMAGFYGFVSRGLIMSAAGRAKHVLLELKAHAPFTLLGALTGITLMLAFRNISHQASYGLFYIFHPLHVVLSAMVTASLFRLHEKARGFLIVLVVGYVGAIGTATVSDSILPFFGEEIMGVSLPTEAAVHSGAHQGEEHHEMKLHLGFIEEWYIVNPAAFLGILIAYFIPRTKLPHALHILISTWASSAHIMMNTNQPITAVLLPVVFVILFISVWLPCCFSDIIFPTLLVKSDPANAGACPVHSHHSHPHEHAEQEQGR